MSLAAGYEMLSVSPSHAAAVNALPDIHGAPFDRILIAQAITEPARLVTTDRRLAEYSDTVILVRPVERRRRGTLRVSYSATRLPT